MMLSEKQIKKYTQQNLNSLSSFLDDFHVQGKMVVYHIDADILSRCVLSDETPEKNDCVLKGVVPVNDWSALGEVIGKKESEINKKEYAEYSRLEKTLISTDDSIVFLYSGSTYVFSFLRPADMKSSLQQQLAAAFKAVYPDASVKLIDKTNFLDIHLPDVHAAKGTHLFFNTTRSGIKVGFYCKDEEFCELALKNSPELEEMNRGIRLKENPLFDTVDSAVKAAVKLVRALKKGSKSKGVKPKKSEKSKAGSEKDNESPVGLTLAKNPKTGEVYILKDAFSDTPEILGVVNTSEKNRASQSELSEFDLAVQAYQRGDLEYVARYVEAGNPVLQFNGDKLITVEIISLVAASPVNLDLLMKVITRGVDLNQRATDEDAYTAVHFAAWDGKIDALKLLLDSGAEAHIKGLSDGAAPIHLASSLGHSRCVELLIDHGAQIDDRDYGGEYSPAAGSTPLLRALMDQQWEVIDLLIDRGANLSVILEPCRKIHNGKTNLDEIIPLLAGEGQLLGNYDPTRLKKLFDQARKLTSSKTKSQKEVELPEEFTEKNNLGIVFGCLAEAILDLEERSPVIPKSREDRALYEKRYRAIIELGAVVVMANREQLTDAVGNIYHNFYEWLESVGVTDPAPLWDSVYQITGQLSSCWEDDSAMDDIFYKSLWNLYTADGSINDVKKEVLGKILEAFSGISYDDFEMNVLLSGDDIEVDSSDGSVDDSRDDSGINLYKDFYCDNYWEREGYKLDIRNFTQKFNSDEERNALLRKFTKKEVDLIIKKIKKNKCYILLPFVKDILSGYMDLSDTKAPFWFMPFVAFGNNVAGFLYFSQDGLHTFDKDRGLINVCNVDAWSELSIEPGYNGLFNDESDDEKLSTLKLDWFNPRSGNEGALNVVEFHQEMFGCTLHVLKAIWDHAWKDVVERSRGSSQFMLGPPPDVESFSSWEELIDWANKK